MNMKTDGFTTKDIRATQVLENVGRSEAVRLLKQGLGCTASKPCEHLYGYIPHWNEDKRLIWKPDQVYNEHEMKFGYCALCGEKL